MLRVQLLLTVRRLVVVQVGMVVGLPGCCPRGVVVQMLPDFGRGARGGRVVGGECGEGRSCGEKVRLMLNGSLLLTL